MVVLMMYRLLKTSCNVVVIGSPSEKFVIHTIPPSNRLFFLRRNSCYKHNAPLHPPVGVPDPDLISTHPAIRTIHQH